MFFLRERWIVRAMDAKIFEDLLDRHGEDFSRWPDILRDAAAHLLLSSHEARATLAEARFLREALSAPPVLAPAGLVDRIFASAARLQAQPSTTDGETIDVSHSV